MALLPVFMLPAAFCFILAFPARSHAQVSFSFNNFSNTSEILATGDAQARNGALWLTADRYFSHGRMMYKQPIHFCDASGEFMASFSTAFTFVILKKNSTLVNADGLAFTIVPNLSPTSEDSYGRWLGLIDPQTNGLASNKVVGVEFDTYYNVRPGYPEFNDIDDNHVGLDLNGIWSANMSSLYPFGVSLHSSRTIAAKIDYDASLHKLKVYASYETSFSNLGDPVLEHSINLCAYVEEYCYVGFSAGAGSSNVDYHNILSWSFSSSP